jgi:threonine dehydratase
MKLTLDLIFRAQYRLRGRGRCTPLVCSAAVSDRLGAEVYLKREEP